MEKDNKGRFVKGPGNTGKPPGAVTKITQEARELFVSILEGEVDYIKDAFQHVRESDPAKYLELYAKYAQYFVPKKVEATVKDERIEVIVPGEEKQD